MSRRSKHRADTRGALLVGAFMVSAALSIAMVALITTSRREIRRAESLLSRDHLRRIAQEKFTLDLLALTVSRDVAHFSSSPVTFAWGEATSTLENVPTGAYLVVTATLTKRNTVDPRHMRLETILHWAPPTPASSPPRPSPAAKRKSLAELIEDQLRANFRRDDEEIEELKQYVLKQLSDMFGSDVEELVVSVETNQYRDAAPPEDGDDDAFFLSPVSVESPKIGPRVRVWRESYF